MGRHPTRRLAVAGLLLALAVVAAGCVRLAPPLFSVTVQAADERDAPLAGALVETSDGQRLSTGPDGRVTIRWTRPGTYAVTVSAEGRVPATITALVPRDNGQTLIARLAPVVAAAPTVVPPGFWAGFLLPGLVMGPGQVGPGQFPYPLIFQTLFSAYGYAVDLAPYQPGEWTSWQLGSRSGQGSQVRKAFLARTGSGGEWWQVRLDEDGLLEVLFSRGRSSVRRLRQRFGADPPREVPVAEGWYTPPIQLTPESIEGAVVERNARVRVPAGEFRADRLEFGVSPGLVLRLWRVTTVPGGTVRYELSDDSGPVWVAELSEYGAGAETELGSY